MSDPYNYAIDAATGRPYPAADGRSPYQDPIDSEQYLANSNPETGIPRVEHRGGWWDPAFVVLV